MNEYIFFNVDTQKDYFEGKYKIPSADAIINNLNDITQFAKQNKIKVINTAGWYPEDAKHLSEMPDYEETFPFHCMMNTEGAKFIKETQPERFTIIDWTNPGGMSLMDVHKSREVAITKKMFDPFEGNPYGESLLHNLGVPIHQRPKFVVYGINVGPTVLGLLRRGYEVVVVADGNRSFRGLPFTQEDIIAPAQNPYPDQVQVKQNVALEFINTKNLISN
ncbi:MAG: cysteine hydrolase family protein [Candidatus Kariarchaeaceae archaeon]|jgi:nicotinamidase-related amidase